MFSLKRFIKSKIKKFAKRSISVFFKPEKRTQNRYIKNRKLFSSSKYQHSRDCGNNS